MMAYQMLPFWENETLENAGFNRNPCYDDLSDATFGLMRQLLVKMQNCNPCYDGLSDATLIK